jgi:ribonuclease-3
MSGSLDQFQARLGYTFREVALLECALTHTSFVPEHPGAESNQRLEYLGDAVLQLVLTESLFQLFPADREGPLSRRRATLANGVFLAQLARDLALDVNLRLGGSEESTGGRSRVSALGDALEAVVGAVFLDSDFPTTRRVVLSFYGDLTERLAAVGEDDNPKGRLQELVQPRHGNDALRYVVTATSGADHARDFEVLVSLFDRPLGQGRGPSKKLAEEAAARAALAALRAEAKT